MGLNEFLDNEETSLVEAKEGSLIVAQQMQDKIIELETKKKELEAASKEMKAQLEKVMRDNSIAGYESNDKRIKISLGEDTTSYDLDKDMLWEKYPDIYRECNVKEIKRKGSLRITIRDEQWIKYI